MRDMIAGDRWLKRLVIATAIGLGWAAPPPSASAATGEEIFKARCVACHTVGGGRRVGPDLAGVTTRRTMDWLIRFIPSPQAMKDSGDPTAVALFKEYDPTPMPDQPVSEAEIRAVMEYIDSGAATAQPAEPAPEATPADIARGQALFEGTARFENGGPTCNSCHDVVHDAVIGGGVLAKGLTTVFTRLGGPGVRAILGSPPFPVMQRAYQGRPLTPSEVTALIGFLQMADRDHMLQQPRDYGLKLALSGAVGVIVLLGLYTLFWRRRRRGPVNQRIYDRQITSSN